MNPKVGVVILTRNRMSVLRSCLFSVLASDYPNYVVTVIDNDSEDDTSKMVLSIFPSVTLLRSELNLGYTGGNNLGIKYAIRNQSCDYLLVLNDDTIVPPNLITKLVNVAVKNSKVGVANPKILDFETKCDVCNSYGEYNFYLGIGHKLLINKSGPQEIGLLRGTCFLIKKDLLLKIGLMDERFFLYFDEADLSYRVKNAKYEILYVPTAIVYHQMLHSFSGRINPAVLYYSTRNELLFARKHLNMAVFFLPWSFRFALRIIQYFSKTQNLSSTKAMIKGFLDFTKGNFGEFL